METKKLLEVNNLFMHFPIKGNEVVHAVDGVSFFVNEGETLGIVGESGCGKSTLARCLVRIYKPTSGEIIFNDTDIASLNHKQLKPFRKDIQMVFQDPYASLDARMVVHDIISEPLYAQGIVKNHKQADEYVTKLLKEVGLSAEHAGRYPHEFSGGQRQRIGIARALVLSPKLVICDEPISALDVSIQAQIVNLLSSFQKQQKLTYIFIAHDLSMVRYVSDRVGVMYLGKMVELCSSEEIYNAPLHPYTIGLLNSIPIADPKHNKINSDPISGDIPSPVHPPSGCRFHTRCPYAKDICTKTEPELIDSGDNHLVACHFPVHQN